MDKYSFELDNLSFSFSSVSLFRTCQYAFKLQYIDIENKVDNFFGDFGSFIHKIMELYWKGELEKEDFIQFFDENYNQYVKTPPPPFPEGMEERYYNDALVFLATFKYNRDDYDIIVIEGSYELLRNEIKITIRPDLILREKGTGKVILLDFKTSKPLKGKKWDDKKIEEYRKQTILYSHFFEEVTGTHIDKIILLFVRIDKEYEIEATPEMVARVISWFENTIQIIKWEEDFPPHVDNYFCANICSVRNSCKYWREIVFKEEYIPE